MRPGFLLLACVLLCSPKGARAAEAATDTNGVWLAEHYTKYEYRIPMRDSVRLFTRIFVPKDDSQAWPIILTRTPYALKPYGEDNYTNISGSVLTLAKDRFILVTQDVRGRYGSEGEYMHVRPFSPNKGPKDTDENSDAYDTIDWLIKNVPNNNGKVGMFGISYPGFYTAMGMIDSHPALKAASPQAPISDWFIGDDVHHNGAFFSRRTLGTSTISPNNSMTLCTRASGLSTSRPQTATISSFAWGRWEMLIACSLKGVFPSGTSFSITTPTMPSGRRVIFDRT